MLMDMDMEWVDDALVIHLNEDRLMANLEGEFRATIAEIIAAGNNRIILNMSRVKFLDSSGLGALVIVKKMLGPEGMLLLCGLTGQVSAIFRVSRMDSVFDIFDDTELALAA